MTHQTPSPPKPRQLTIGSDHYEYQLNDRSPRPPAVPVIRLRGYWLQQAGFSAGQRVSIQIADQRIIIVPAP